ncbi:hypothetical protein EDB89DRAFT_1901057 [Lactarius sanguifluus]|nr:hypothetical protein EDB89DRAFT_1901057 [Lactarius sanguifluus]
MAVADAVAALAGCWRRLVVFVQLEAVSADLRHVVIESRVVVGRSLAVHVAWIDYDNHKPRQHTVPNTTRTAIPMTTTTQRAVAATTMTHRRRFIIHPQRQRQQTSTASDDTTGSSNDDYDDAIDGNSGAAITRRAMVVTRMRWRGVLASASTRGSDGYSRREYECQLGKLGEYESSTTLHKVPLAASEPLGVSARLGGSSGPCPVASAVGIRNTNPTSLAALRSTCWQLWVSLPLPFTTWVTPPIPRGNKMKMVGEGSSKVHTTE